MPSKIRPVAMLALAMCFFPAALAQSAAPGSGPAASAPSVDLAGLWASEQVLFSLVRGELTIHRRGKEWRARIGGYQLPVQKEKDAFSLAIKHPGPRSE